MKQSVQELTCSICQKAEVGHYGTKAAFTYHKCPSCGVIYLKPLPQAVHEIYSDDYFAGGENGHGYVNYDADKDAMKQVFHDYLTKIEKTTQGRTLFDVGAATGYFIDLAAGRGWSGAGVELSPFATELAKRKGIDVVQGTLGSIKRDRKYHVVTMWDVLEHVLDPHSDIKAVHSMLHDDGVVVINTPDSSSLYARSLGMKWHLFVPPEHIYLHTKKSITALLEKNDFQVIEYTKIGKKFSIEYIVHILAQWTMWKIWKPVGDFLMRHQKIGLLSVPINLRDNMFVVARKR